MKTPKPLPSQDELLALLRYEPESGKLFWRRRPREECRSDGDWKSWNTRCAGQEAFTADRSGYRVGGVRNQIFYAHRIIAKILWGIDAQEIDHINGNRQDNRAANLRIVNRPTNGRNMARRFDNSSGQVGVGWLNRERRWCARIVVDRCCILLGYFVEKSDAVRVRKLAETRYGFHPNHGREARAF